MFEQMTILHEQGFVWIEKEANIRIIKISDDTEIYSYKVYPLEESVNSNIYFVINAKGIEPAGDHTLTSDEISKVMIRLGDALLSWFSKLSTLSPLKE